MVTAIAEVISRAVVAFNEDETLRLLAMFCGAGLLVSLLLMICGIDLSTGF